VARYDDDLRFAHVLADNADDITTRRFRALDLRVDTKPDLTPVTDADQAAEDSLRNVLRRSRPRDAVLGEELGRSGSGPRCWVIDPIDGTKNYVRGVPVWATLIGLMDGPDVVVGVVSAPALNRRWWGALGGGAWTGRSLTKASPCRVSGVTKLGDASLSYSGLGGWSDRGLLDNFLGLTRSVWRSRAFGDFWSHMLVAEGACDVSAEPEVSLWDMAALQIIVTEAGGRFTSLEGDATPDGGSVVCTNGHLHDEVLAQLRPSGYLPWGVALGAELTDAGGTSQMHKRRNQGVFLVNVRDGMSQLVLTIGPAHTLRQAARMMAARHIGAAVVIDQEHAGIGILTERDILNSVAAGEDPDAELAAQHRTEELTYASPDWTLEDAAAAMIRGGFRHLIVIEGHDVAGLLSMRDIVRCWTTTPASQPEAAATPA
jgi:histidinol-phosphatase